MLSFLKDFDHDLERFAFELPDPPCISILIAPHQKYFTSFLVCDFNAQLIIKAGDCGVHCKVLNAHRPASNTSEQVFLFHLKLSDGM